MKWKTLCQFICFFSVLGLACWNEPTLLDEKNTHYRNEFDANPATCSFLRAFRYIEDQIKSSHRVSMSAKHHPESAVTFFPFRFFHSVCCWKVRIFQSIFNASFVRQNNLIGNKCYTVLLFVFGFVFFSSLYCLGHKSL